MLSSTHHLLDRISNLLRGGEGVAIVEMGVAKRRSDARVTQQPSDHRNGLGPPDGVAGESVAKVVDA